MSIPKKPLAVSRAKKKLPVELDWGPGVPKDRLAYINADEKALIQRFRKTKAAREYAGVPAFASDSASSKGVERGADGPSGVGRGSGSGGSSTSSSSSGSKSTSSSSSTSGGGNKGASPSTSGTSTSWGGASSASKSSAASAGPSKAPNAAAQAASNKLNSTQSRSGGPATNAASTSSVSRSASSTSKAPNAAASYASGKLNATANALKSAQQPQSIQGMINSGTSTPWGGSSIPQPASPYPSQFNNDMLGFNAGRIRSQGITDPKAKMDSLHNLTQFSEVGYNAEGVQKIKDRYGYTPVGIRTNNPGNILDSGWQKNMPGYTGPVTSPNGLTYASYKDPRYGLAAQNELLGRYYDGGRTTINEVVDRYAPVDENNSAAANKAYKEHLSAQTGFGINDQLTREQVQSLGPYKTAFENGGTILAGGPFGGAATPATTTALAATARPSEPSAPRPQAIPSPISEGMLNTKMAQSRVVTDPRVSMPPGSLAPPERGSPPGYMSQFAMNEQDMANLKTQAMKDFSFGDLMKMQQNQAALPGFMGPITKDAQRVAQAPAPVQQAATVPQGPLPSALPGFKPPGLPGNFRGTAGQAYTYNSPSNRSPQVAAGDAVPEDGPVYSDNPMQGPVNPMQEGAQVEDPGVTKQRQNKYASTGATIGSVIAGPLGAVVGGTLGWQMGKTSPQQRQAIASNPKAVQANVQSINQMVEERGGKGNPQMRVTEAGFRDVLTNPQKVTQNPGNYTTLEQMLAALAQGIDPETGKPIA